jgi:hypothetical protein
MKLIIKIIKPIFLAYLCFFVTPLTANNHCQTCNGPANYRGPCCPRLAPPQTAYDFSQQFNEKKVWMEFRNGEWYICTQRLPLYREMFYVTPNIVCTKAHPAPAPDNAPEGAHCWRSGKRTVCRNDAGEMTVHG